MGLTYRQSGGLILPDNSLVSKVEASRVKVVRETERRRLSDDWDAAPAAPEGDGLERGDYWLFRNGKERLDPVVVMFWARRGRGKSLSMTAMASMMKQRYKVARVNRKFYSNYWTAFSDDYGQELIDEIVQFPEDARDCLMGIDEAQAYFPGAKSTRNMTVDFVGFLTQIRKRRVEIMFTTQFPQVITGNLLMQVDLFVEVETFKLNGRTHVNIWAHDWWGQWTGDIAANKHWPPPREFADWSWTLWNVDAMFGQYDTDQVIAPVWSKARRRIIEQGDRGRPVTQGDEDTPAELIEAAMESQEDMRRSERNIAQARTLEEFLRSAPDGFNLNWQFKRVQEIAPEITSPKLWKAWLENHGYAVEKFHVYRDE